MPYIGNQPYQGIIDSSNIADGSIQTGDLANSAVTNAKLANSTITINGTSVALGGSTSINVTPTTVSDQTNSSTGYFDLPSGTTAERPASPNIGMSRYNTTLNSPEIYTNTGWIQYGQLPPAISTVSPTTYNGESGSVFTINGANFTSDATVEFITSQNVQVLASVVQYINSSQILATTPRDFTVAEEPLDVKVTQQSGIITKIDCIDCGGTPTWTTAAGNLGTINTNANQTWFTVEATDPDAGGTITYSIVSGILPSGLSLNNSSGVISGQTTTIEATTTYNFTIRATDNAGNTNDRAFSLIVDNVTIVATGGTITTNSLFKFHTFTSADVITGNSTLTGGNSWFSPGYFGVDKGYILQNGKTYTNCKFRRVNTGSYYWWLLFVSKSGNSYTPIYGSLISVGDGGGSVGNIMQHPLTTDDAGNGLTLSTFGSSTIPNTGTYYLAWLSSAPGYTAPSGSIYVTTPESVGFTGSIDYVSTSTAPTLSTTYTATALNTGQNIHIQVSGHDSNFAVSSAKTNATAEILLVGGGGASGAQTGGGGGGGGVIHLPNYGVTSSTNYSIQVGAGGGANNYTGNSGSASRGKDGGDTKVTVSYTSTGGGAGGSYYNDSASASIKGGSAGGSGGGGGAGGNIGSGGAGVSGQGNSGGNGNNGAPWYGGGGGGFSSSGTSAANDGTGQQYSGQGGAGYPTDITGTFTYHSTGGGGCGQGSDLGGYGGSYGWGSQGGSDTAAPTVPQGGYGHGGGGTRDYLGYGGASRDGEGGVVIIKYPLSYSWAGSYSGNPATSAAAIKAANPSVPNGIYWITINGVSTPVYCDMTTDGGGWMLYACKTTATHVPITGTLSSNAYTMTAGNTQGKVPTSSFTQLMWRFANITARPYVTKYVKADDVGAGKGNWNSWIVSPSGTYVGIDVGGWYRSTNGGATWGSVYRMQSENIGGAFHVNVANGISQSHNPSSTDAGTDKYLDLWNDVDGTNLYLGTGAGVEGTSSIGMKCIAGYCFAYEPVWYFWK